MLRCTLSFLLAIAFLPCLAQTSNRKLSFHSSKGQVVSAQSKGIYVNGQLLRQLHDVELIIPSRRSKLIEDKGSVFLFLEIFDGPDKNKFYVYQIFNDRADSITTAISSEIKDYDGDDYLEFGGQELTEMHPSEDSMYYIPTEYYEIRNGKIFYDSALTREMDIRLNGIYLRHPGDENGSCCKVIEKPGKTKITQNPLIHPLIQSERIDGPANSRDAINGKLLFSLNENVPVITADSSEKWYMIALTLDLTKPQFDSRIIPKGTFLHSNGMEVGKAKVDLHLGDTIREGDDLKGIIMGYTSIQNIKPATLPENVLSRLLTDSSTLNLAQLHDFIKGFHFVKSQMGHYPTFELDGGIVYGGAVFIRLLLVFDKDNRLMGIIHLRQLPLAAVERHSLNRGYEFSVLGNPDPGFVQDFSQIFNSIYQKN